MITLPDLGSNGRLGNQVFQLAAAYAHCLRTGADLTLPRIELTERIAQRFNIVPRSGVPRLDAYHEPRFSYTPIPQHLTHCSLYGYFQSERYFDDHAKTIRDLLLPSESVMARAKANIATVRESGRSVVALCVRRTDYVAKQAFHPLCPMSYYEQAVAMFPGAAFYVFSDDMPWCHANIKFPHAHFCDEADHWVKLWTMSLCDHHIIANSTYHWWGAWLSTSERKRVVAPLTWFGPAAGELQNQTGDICPGSWTRI